MVQLRKFLGTGVAMITPFLANGFVDYSSLKKNTEYLISGGVDYLVVLGTTGESAVLQPDEREAVIRTVIEQNNGRLKIVVGYGGNYTDKVCRQIDSADFDGVDGILSVSPYYNRPSQRGIYEHFMAIDQVSPVPVILYNVPGRTGSNMDTETTLKLAHDGKNLVAIKEASGNIQQCMNIIASKPANFDLISGDDAITLPLMSFGAIGVISVIANAFPGFSQLAKAMLNDNHEKANQLHQHFLPLIDLIFREGSPGGVKAMMAQLHLCQEQMRLPNFPVSENLKEKIALSIENGILESID